MTHEERILELVDEALGESIPGAADILRDLVPASVFEALAGDVLNRIAHPTAYAETPGVFEDLMSSWTLNFDLVPDILYSKVSGEPHDLSVLGALLSGEAMPLEQFAEIIDRAIGDGSLDAAYLATLDDAERAAFSDLFSTLTALAVELRASDTVNRALGRLLWGNDHLGGTDGANALSGQPGDDDIRGFGGDDILDGNDGDDTVSGGDGSDRIDGASGDDELQGNAGDDRMDGGHGSDRIFGNAGDDDIRGGPGAGSDSLSGGDGDDVLADGVRLLGGDGDDILKSGTSLDGGRGDDVLIGGRFVKGGRGFDVYKVTGSQPPAREIIFDDAKSVSAGGRSDLVHDFERGRDTIDFSGIDAKEAKDGDQAFRWIGTDAFSGKAGELRYAMKGDTAFVSGDTDGDGKADFTLEIKGPDLKLTASDFEL
jgi:Ca2+-binding RTX toxin-like protein